MKVGHNIYTRWGKSLFKTSQTAVMVLVLIYMLPPSHPGGLKDNKIAAVPNPDSWTSFFLVSIMRNTTHFSDLTSWSFDSFESVRSKLYYWAPIQQKKDKSSACSDSDCTLTSGFRIQLILNGYHFSTWSSTFHRLFSDRTATLNSAHYSHLKP